MQYSSPMHCTQCTWIRWKKSCKVKSGPPSTCHISHCVKERPGLISVSSGSPGSENSTLASPRFRKQLRYSSCFAPVKYLTISIVAWNEATNGVYLKTGYNLKCLQQLFKKIKSPSWTICRRGCYIYFIRAYNLVRYIIVILTNPDTVAVVVAMAGTMLPAMRLVL